MFLYFSLKLAIFRGLEGMGTTATNASFSFILYIQIDTHEIAFPGGKISLAIRHINSKPINLTTPLWWTVLTAAQSWYGLMALFYTTPQSSNMNADVASYSLLNIKTAIMTSCLLSQICSNSNSENENKQGRWDMHLFFRPWKHEKVLRRNPWFVCYSRRRR